jgi:uncharacterized membrane protein
LIDIVRRTSRLEAFNDSVLAIAITLPVLDLHFPQVPPDGNLSDELAKPGPRI